MTPFRAIARLAEPVVTYDDGLHFDGLLAWCCYAERCEQGYGDQLNDPDLTDWPVDFDVPLDRWRAPLVGECHARLLDDSGRLWGWCGSDVFWPDGYVEGSVALRKMTDVDQLVRGTDADRYKQTTGVLKNKDKTYPTRQAREVCWYGVGDIGRVDALLSRYLTHLGKLHGHGQGRVQEWEVEAMDHDRSVTHESVLTRRMPASWCEASSRPRRGGVRPPYWHESRKVKCYEPGTPIDGME